MIATRNLPALVALSGGMTGSKLRRLKARRWKYPLSLERQYTTAIARYLDKVWREYSALAVGTMVPRSDAVDLNPDGTGPALAAIVSVAKNMADFNKKELGAFQSIAIGTAFTEDETWLPATLDRWAREQVTLITKASQDMRDAVARRVREGIKNGELGRDITRKIAMDLPRISYNRAKIIARDQTAKLNGDLTQGRMTDAGLETYIWDTAQDERVRGNPGGKYADAVPSHWVMQGLVCRWDNPAVCRNEHGEWVSRPPEAPTTHPGMAIMCRCVARPNWGELENVGPLDVPVAAGVTASSIPEPTPVVESVAGTFENVTEQTEHPKIKSVLNYIETLEGAQFTPREIATAIKSYTGSSYVDIRRAQMGELRHASAHVKEASIKDGDALEDFIRISPKWNGGTAYRGMILETPDFNDIMRKIAEGAELDMRGTSSWTSSSKIAQNFARGYGSNVHDVVLVNKGRLRGTSIRDISNVASEEEILVSKHARFRVLGSKQVEKTTYIEVEEVSGL